MSEKEIVRAVIIGGGIGGLACAHRLQQLAKEKNQQVEIKLLEASHRLGGVIQTQNKDGFFIEGGPDCFISEKPAGLSLVRELDLENQLLETTAKYRRSFILHRGRLHSIPEGFYLMAPTAPWPFLRSPLMTWPGKFRAGLELFLPRRKHTEDETLASFVRRRFGQELLDRMAQPLVAGIYSADPEELSLAATMPRFLDLESKYGSVTRGLLSTLRTRASGPRYSLFLSFREGMETLVRGLLDRVDSSVFHTHSPVSRISQDSHGTWTVKTPNESSIQADALFLALPAHQSASLLNSEQPQIANVLKNISYSTSITVNFGFHRSQISHSLNGMGFVIPNLEKRNLLACSFSSQKFAGRAPQDKVLLRSFIGGHVHQALMEKSADELISVVEAELRQILGIQGPPIHTSYAKWTDCMPQYALGHLDRIEKLEQMRAAVRGLYLVGNGFRGVGVPDVIESANRAAHEAMNRFDRGNKSSN